MRPQRTASGPSPHPRSRRGEDGAIFTEFLIILPLLLAMVFGIVEFGMVFDKSLTVSNALRSGTRVVSGASSDTDADFLALQAISSSLGEVDPASVDRVIIYKPAIPNAEPHPNCLTAGALAAGGDVTGQCNVYDSAELFAPNAADFTGPCDPSRHDHHWCATSRDAKTTGGVDPIAIRVIVEHEFITGIFPWGNVTITDTLVMRVEPRGNV